eukprot:m.25956 g.25956  ORF g.25956 m.25956 type:complete len:301 (+) comp37973_c1_seq1:3-905(+)
MLKNRRQEKKTIDDNHMRLLWQQMLEAVQTIHDARIVHGDLKPANFLIVGGILKLIDFGIATGIQDEQTSVVRENQIGTLNYMAPEAIQPDPSVAAERGTQGLKVRAASDVWSLGCILYLMVYGRTPFQHLTSPIQKLQAIVSPTFLIDFPDLANKALIDVMKLCLQRDPRQRPSIQDLCDHSFLHPERAVAVATPVPQRHAVLSDALPTFKAQHTPLAFPAHPVHQPRAHLEPASAPVSHRAKDVTPGRPMQAGLFSNENAGDSVGQPVKRKPLFDVQDVHVKRARPVLAERSVNVGVL